MKYKALDLFCGAGGAARGMQLAGFHVTGIDHKPQPRYAGDVFIQADALKPPVDLREFDFIWASPPCQRYSLASNTQDKSQYPDLIEPVRNVLEYAAVPYVIENVIGAPLERPILLCGAMFGLQTYRHRLFETSFLLLAPGHPPHRWPVAKMGRPPNKGEFLSPVGHFSGVLLAREMFGLHDASQYELSQAIPPAYAEFIAREFLRTHMESAA